MALDPGYIKRYLPGIRENGGQYTHAAVWTAMAIAALGNGDEVVELFHLLNPINHARSRQDVERYQVEPYVVAADVYSSPRHAGRGGWTWYTGSAGWLYRAGVEWLLGVRLRGTRLLIDPCIPAAWPGFTVTMHFHSTRYDISVENPGQVCRGVTRLELDGASMDDRSGVSLVDDRQVHRVRVVMGVA